MDKRARVELHSKNKTISVDVNCIQDLYADANNNNNANNDSINTPRHYPTAKTPTYFPQSPSYNNQSWNPSTRKFFTFSITNKFKIQSFSY
jgi:transcription elongation factor